METPWFDNECFKTKNELSSLSRTLKQNPADQTTRSDITKLKRNFKKMIIGKKGFMKITF